MFVSEQHPLTRLFRQLVAKRLAGDAQIRDPQVTDYVTRVLVDFTDARNLYRIRNVRGKRLEDVGEMLLEASPLFEARSFLREREVRKHIGDYTLFLTGLFPEYVATLPRQRLRLDALIDYVQTGKESYRVVSYFDQFEFRKEAPLFRKLSENFELCVYGLNLVKSDLERMQHPEFRKVQETWDSP